MNNNEYIKDIHDYNLDINNRAIFLNNYPSIVDDSNIGVDHKMVADFVKNIRILESINNSPILIHMNSIGGNWSDGMAIYDTIISCKSYVTILVYGQAESMSSIILQAADRRIMMPNAYFMSHFGSTSISGNYLDVHQFCSFEKAWAFDKMLEIYTARCAKGRFFKERYPQENYDKVKSFLKRKLKDGDWYLEANKAVYYGFADAVLGDKNFKNMDSL